MCEEISAMEKNMTWELVKPPKDYKPIGVKRVYKIKRDYKGDIMRHKATLG